MILLNKRTSKVTWLILLTLFEYQTSNAQLDFKNSNTGRLVNFDDVNGHSLLKKYDPEISGSPWLSDEWMAANLKLTKGKEIGPIMVKFNLESNELIYKDSAGRELAVVEGIVKKVTFLTYKDDSTLYTLGSGYPDIDNQTRHFFYNILTEGKISFLAKNSKHIGTRQDAFTNLTTKNFEDDKETLYIYLSDNIQVFHPDKKFILSLMQDKHEQVSAYAELNKVNFKKKSDVVKLFKYYNDLSK